MTRDWWPDELDHAGAEHLDPGYVAGYDAKAQVDPAPDVTLLAQRGMGPQSTVVDLGAGTGRLALDQGRTVMAVPGALSSPVSAGPNGLIRDGAPAYTAATFDRRQPEFEKLRARLEVSRAAMREKIETWELAI